MRWIVETCPSKAHLLSYALSHWSHLKFFSFLAIFPIISELPSSLTITTWRFLRWIAETCLSKVSLSLNSLSHWSHFTFLWNKLRCEFKWLFCLNSLPQTSHGNLILRWTAETCTSNCCLPKYVLSHCSHLKFFFFLAIFLTMLWILKRCFFKTCW